MLDIQTKTVRPARGRKAASLRRSSAAGKESGEKCGSAKSKQSKRGSKGGKVFLRTYMRTQLLGENNILMKKPERATLESDS